MKLFVPLLSVALLAAVAATVPATAATAAPPAAQLSAQLEAADDFLAAHGVDGDTRDRLIERYVAGGRWDSFSNESLPARVETGVVDGFRETVAHYADGSVSVTRVEQPRTESALRDADSSPNSCSVDGDMRNDCSVDTWVGLIQLSFKASYNVATDDVTNVYGAGWQIGGACSSSLVSLGIPAHDIGRLDVSAQMCGAPYNSTFFLAVTLSDGVATESWG
ncbi:hypothetical protein [Herbiconiux sp. VKM Ac-2851]|uniref:hypothetical protein n=1 Tax=Herbiconiux sp. VKM Ac-2851 TaxID=2739025 RepID=UPI001567517E|nr:hypothetical protein [Herbiconiux sp. VKM Ac-2851]NQX34954.1 hypothetical protein [Herbiconiux sp. VKM Ac-2851]